MNYNSIEEILSSGITNMEVIRDNSKQDDGTDTITGVDWFTYNGTVASSIYVNGNSFIGFGSNSEHLKVNRRDGAMYSLYREEGTLYNYYKFLKIRWKGYSAYNNTSSSYALEYDVILWDTGDISLHMISIPTSYNTGTYSLVASSTYSYTASSSSPDITFVKTDSGFEVSNSIIVLTIPYEKRYLVRSGSTYYTINNDTLVEVEIETLTSDAIMNFGIESIPQMSLLTGLTEPEVIFWTDNDNILDEENLYIKGMPLLPQFVYYEQQDISNYSGIKKVECLYSKDAVFSVSFDDGQTWNYYEDGNWCATETDSDGMTSSTMLSIPESAWSEISTSTLCRFRCALLTSDGVTSNIYIKYTD